MSEVYKSKGKLVEILEIKRGTSKAGKEWCNRKFVIDTGAEFKPLVAFGLFGDEKCEMISAFSIGATLEVAFNISSNEHNGNYYNNIDAWSINEIEGESTVDAIPVDDDDDLPF